MTDLAVSLDLWESLSRIVVVEALLERAEPMDALVLVDLLVLVAGDVLVFVDLLVDVQDLVVLELHDLGHIRTAMRIQVG